MESWSLTIQWNGTSRCIPSRGLDVPEVESLGKGSIKNARNDLPPRVSRSWCASSRVIGVGRPSTGAGPRRGRRGQVRRIDLGFGQKTDGARYRLPAAAQDAKGGWSTQREPGITALVVTALLHSGQVAPGEPVVTKALAYLEGFISPKGGLSEAHTPITRLRSRFWRFEKPIPKAATTERLKPDKSF